MKNSILLIIISLFLISSCIFIKPIDDDRTETIDCEQLFYITDTLKHSASSFLSGESFLINYSLINTSEDTLWFYTPDGRPPFIINILKDGAKVTSCVDGFGFISIPCDYHILPEDTFSTTWKAPKTTSRYSKTVLPAGEYQAQVEYPYFGVDEVIDSVQNIDFTIDANPELLVGEFTMTDSLGNHEYRFEIGESFNLDFKIINSSYDTVFYTKFNSGPEIQFQILQYDSIIATSMDGYGTHPSVTTAFLESGDSLVGNWLAPTTADQNPKVMLTPGWYRAKVIYPDFEDINVHQTDEKWFLINEQH